MTSLIIFFCVGALWLPVLVLQKRLYVMASSALGDGRVLGDRYSSVYQKWFWMGVFGFLGMFVIVLIMVTKMTPPQWIELLKG